MPHKKNPDVFEVMRAKCNKLQGLPAQIMLIMNNLPSGYFRDLQVIKELFIPAFDELEDCLDMAAYIVERIEVNEHLLNDSRYDAMFSVEEVNCRVLKGTPFRDAYKQVGLEIEAGQFVPNKEIRHTHEGSIGNLCTKEVAPLMDEVIDGFGFADTIAAEQKLIKG
jgi:argininosuccinate lyase